MARIYWTDRGRERFDALPGADQNAVDWLLANVAQYPEMYAEILDRPRWRGHRKFLVRGRWIVLYRVNKSASPYDDQVYVVDIVPARSNY